MDERAVVTAGLLLALGGCGGGSSSLEVPEGAATPDQAVEVFMRSAQEANNFKTAGELASADQAYERMAGVFGTERGSIKRSFSKEEVHDRMVVLAACLRPTAFRKLSQLDPRAGRTGSTTVSVELTRGDESVTLAFSVIRGRAERWFVERIDLTNFSC